MVACLNGQNLILGASECKKVENINVNGNLVKGFMH